MHSQRALDENLDFLTAFSPILLKFGRVNKLKWSYVPLLSRQFSLHRIDKDVLHVTGLKLFHYFWQDWHLDGG